MAKSTTNTAKMKSVATELESIYKLMMENKKKLDELMTSLAKVWRGEGAEAYLRAYNTNSNNIVQLGQAIQNCSVTLNAITTSYQKADYAANEAISKNMIKG